MRTICMIAITLLALGIPLSTSSVRGQVTYPCERTNGCDTTLVLDENGHGFSYMSPNRATQEWTFSATAGDVLDVCILTDEGAFSPVLRVIAPDQNVLSEASNSIQGIEILSTGQHTIQIDSSDGWGTYQLSVLPDDPDGIFGCVFNVIPYPNPFCEAPCTQISDIEFGRIYTSRVDPVGNPVDIWRFSASSGDVVSVCILSHEDSFSPTFALTQSGGSISGEVDSRSSQNSSVANLVLPLGWTIPTEMGYQIAVQGAEMASGLYDVIIFNGIPESAQCDFNQLPTLSASIPPSGDDTSVPEYEPANLSNTLEFSPVFTIQYPSDWTATNAGFMASVSASNDMYMVFQHGDTLEPPLTADTVGREPLALMQNPEENWTNVSEITIDGIRAVQGELTNNTDYQVVFIYVLPPNSDVWMAILLGAKRDRWNEFYPVAEQMIGTLEWIVP